MIASNVDPPIPTIEEVQRILQIQDPVICNLRITQCYHELSAVLDRRTGLAANWCTFATWASRQAGQTIRKEDFKRLIENRLRRTPSVVWASENVAAAAANIRGARQIKSPQDLALRAENFLPALDRASEAVSRGNKKVFAEIGFEFARFYLSCLLEPGPNNANLASFCEALRPGEPPDGQGYLHQAFTHYYQALYTDQAKTLAELILLANIEIGFHEQTRLQPEIAESLDAGLVTFLHIAQPLLAVLFFRRSWLYLAFLYFMRLLGRPTTLDLALQALLAEVRVQLRHVITEIMMTITLPSSVLLRLGQDLTAGFPESLKRVTNPELTLILEKYDPTPDSLVESGAMDWADLPDRLHFIIDLFRCYQEDQRLFEAPFTPEQVQAFKDGRLPLGEL